MEKVRVSKLMAERGLCSRREADSYIERGWVKYDVVEIPVKWHHEEESKVKTAGAMVSSFRELLAIRLLAWRGKYGKKA